MLNQETAKALARANQMPARCCARCVTRNVTDVIYLDMSALMKLVRDEAGSDELTDWLDRRIEMPWVTSTLADVELPRAIIRTTAAAYQNPHLCSLDAIHLATASVAASVAPLAALDEGATGQHRYASPRRSGRHAVRRGQGEIRGAHGWHGPRRCHRGARWPPAAATPRRGARRRVVGPPPRWSDPRTTPSPRASR